MTPRLPALIDLETLPEERFARTRLALRAGVRDGVATAFSVGLLSLEAARPVAVGGALGTTRGGEAGVPVSLTTAFDLSSVTKVFSTWSVIGALATRGWLSLETPLGAFSVAARASDRVKRITLAQLLDHSSGLPAWGPFWEGVQAKAGGQDLRGVSATVKGKHLRELVAEVDVEAEAGRRHLYSDVNFLWLGFVAEELLGTRLDRAFLRLGFGGAEFRPIRDTAFVDADSHQIAATEHCEWRDATIQGEVHDENAWAAGGAAGHAGLFAHVGSLLGFAEAVLRGWPSKAYWEASFASLGRAPRVLGWDVRTGARPSSGSHFSSRTVGHLGFSGTSLWIDLEKRVAIALLTNRIHPTRRNLLIRDFRPRMHDAIWEDFAEAKIHL